jgi:hypothetical protein
MVLFMEIGRRIGRIRIQRNWESPAGIFLGLEESVFGLMGLLIAFTFSVGAARYEFRRQLVVEETNDIGTAWKRLDILPASSQNALREAFRQYVDSRLEDNAAEENAMPMARSAALQDAIWRQAVAACADAGSTATTNLVLASLNAMIDITTTRTMAARTHLPIVIRILLVVLPLICSLLAGLSSAADPRRSWVHILTFALMVSFIVFVILDLDYPRAGLTRIDHFDLVLVELRNSIH